jgi:RHS repeat-associated protein
VPALAITEDRTGRFDEDDLHRRTSSPSETPANGSVVQTDLDLAARVEGNEYEYDALPQDLLDLAEDAGTAANGPSYGVPGRGNTCDAAANLTYDHASNIIIYEEYNPFGTSSYRAVDSTIQVSAKRYRYAAAERDEETGLDHMGLRYYAPWLGRWTSADPIGLGDGPNRYAYVRNNPVSMRDPGGTRTEEVAEGVGPIREYMRAAEGTSVGKQRVEDLNDAIRAAADLAIATGEADERAYRQEIAENAAGISEVRAARREAWKFGVRALFSGKPDLAASAARDVAMAGESLRELRGVRRELQSQSELRGHDVEWSNIVYERNDGTYGITGALPGGPRLKQGSELIQPEGRVGAEHTGRSRATVVADVHTHPRFGDPEQARRVDQSSTSIQGLDPSPEDLAIAAVYPESKQVLVNQRGRIQVYNETGNVGKPLREGLARDDLRRTEFGAVTSARQERPEIDSLIQEAAGLLRRAGLREALLKTQRDDALSRSYR